MASSSLSVFCTAVVLALIAVEDTKEGKISLYYTNSYLNNLSLVLHTCGFCKNNLLKTCYVSCFAEVTLTLQTAWEMHASESL